jgi:hypothetical protein
MKRTLYFLLLLLSVSQDLLAQSGLVLRGTVRDIKTGETLIGASVAVKELGTAGAISNEYGFYSLSLPSGSYTLLVSFTGYTTAVVPVSNSSGQQDVLLIPSAQLTEVVVKSKGKSDNIRSAQMGMESLNLTDIKAVPVLFGEKDVLKTLQLLPGVKSGGDGNGGFYVRGGGADQNLILLDGAPVYNPSHLLGFFSTFNSDAIKDVTLYKGGMPAQFGGRLSSVEDIHMNDGNKKEYHVSGGLGLISSRLNVEGPLGSGKGSFLLAGRRTYADAFLKLSSDEKINKNKLRFYDVNFKANYKLGDKDQVFVSVYNGKDKLGFKDDFNVDWSNTAATLRWNHLLSSKLFSNTSLIYSDYHYNIRLNSGGEDYSMRSSIRDFSMKEDLSFFASPRSSYRFGVQATQHTTVPGRLTNEASGFEYVLQDRRSLEGAAYLSHNYKLSEQLTMEYGVRLSGFAALGEGRYYQLNDAHEVSDTLRYGAGEVAQSYVMPEPRASLSYAINNSRSVKASYARNAQYLHLLSNSASTTPFDKWTSANNIIEPGISDQVSLGYFQNFGEGRYEFSAETYYKTMQHQVDYKDGADIFSYDAIETQLLFGKGRAYGLELLLKKKTGTFTGWVSYTLSRSELQIDGINHNEWYAARQDRTHDLSVVGIYQATPKWTLSGTFVYNTGAAMSFPSGKYSAAGNNVYYYAERNGYRMPAYHRLDLSATRQLAHTKRFSSELALGLFNAYGRENAYSINFQQSADNPARTEAVQTTLFRWIPSITYNFKF